MPAAYINIGSNQGDRRANIARAVALIADMLHVKPRLSHAVESEPWGYESASPYINIGLAFDTVLTPETLLDTLLSIERSISAASHRKPDGSYADRLIDIDLIAYGNAAIEMSLTPEGNLLTLPHPRMHLREFVLLPMQQLAPEWKHPLTGHTPAEMLNALK
ncbi:MAG: 2-amino-4-hydroxy-6-hydroxymethyldihydropteridine diphosphokinase [Muribaculum sp.]|nr:2-amino-4-hydroxy-6-hydroxymethyldihydropteridine diphosphokinase [Muribaculum sp.]